VWPVRYRRPMPGASSSTRFDRLDALRGAAIVWMAIFHFCFDLAWLHFTRENFYADPFWTVQRSAIVTLFVLCAGMGQGVATRQGQEWPRFWRRWAQIAACALLVTAGSALAFPRSYISFGILHGLAVMLIVARLTAGAGRWLWLLGALGIVLPQLMQHVFFDTRGTNWFGFTTRKPVTEDYAPVFPWIGVMWWGMAAAQWLLDRHPTLLAGAVPRALQPLSVLGRWSLSFYMLHQPVLIGVLMAVAMLRPA